MLSNNGEYIYFTKGWYGITPFKRYEVEALGKTSLSIVNDLGSISYFNKEEDKFIVHPACKDEKFSKIGLRY